MAARGLDDALRDIGMLSETSGQRLDRTERAKTAVSAREAAQAQKRTHAASLLQRAADKAPPAFHPRRAARKGKHRKPRGAADFAWDDNSGSDSDSDEADETGDARDSTQASQESRFQDDVAEMEQQQRRQQQQQQEDEELARAIERSLADY
eukprot:m51a1_g7106 hypothetical protein (152) ;mRNA; f:60905-61360